MRRVSVATLLLSLPAFAQSALEILAKTSGQYQSAKSAVFTTPWLRSTQALASSGAPKDGMLRRGKVPTAFTRRPVSVRFPSPI